MQAVLDHMQARREAYSRLPLFDHLRKSGADPLAALGFMRHAAHFAMSFADLNKYAFRDEERPGGWQHDVNARTRQGDHRGPRYLNDLIALGLADRLSFAETLQFLWSDANRETRLLSYRLWALADDALPLERMVIIEAIEATEAVFFGHLVSLARRVAPERLSRPLIYVAGHPCAVEQGHSTGQATHDERLAAVRLCATERRRCIDMVDAVFSHFGVWSDELHGHATSLVRLEAANDRRAVGGR